MTPSPSTDIAPVRRVNGDGGDAKAHDSGPLELYRHATDVAGVCGNIVKQTAKSISGRKFVCVEGWQAITTAHGCALSIDSVIEDAEGNVTANASVRRMSDGVTLATAEGFVGMDEPRWSKCPRYARRAMAQTRAMSRVARAVFAHVVILIDKGLATTPAEEMEDAAPSQFRGRRDRAPDVDVRTGEVIEPEPVPLALPEQVRELNDLVAKAGIHGDTVNKWLARAGATTLYDLPMATIDKCIAFAKSKLAANTGNGATSPAPAQGAEAQGLAPPPSAPAPGQPAPQLDPFGREVARELEITEALAGDWDTASKFIRDAAPKEWAKGDGMRAVEAYRASHHGGATVPLSRRRPLYDAMREGRLTLGGVIRPAGK